MIKFKYNNKGKKLAYQLCTRTCRWIRISLDKAELLLATETAVLVEEGVL